MIKLIMQKIACIFSYKMSNWVSCQKIVFNLHKAYALNPDLELKNYNYALKQTAGEWLQTAQQIFADQPDTLVIMDHKPHPVHLLQILLPWYNDQPQKPRIIFHVFGDFTLNYPNWQRLAPLLKNFQVQFLVASKRQKKLFDKFLPEEKADICPFPVDEKDFSYRPQLRSSQRMTWGLKENEIAFVFTGRLSQQKRIKTLITGFAQAWQQSSHKTAHLFLYGHTDDIGDPFLNKMAVEGEYFHTINMAYQSLPEEIKQRIHFMGAVPNEELKAVYQGADALVNLSVHNDEDFGMSVAEAQSSGLPVILTDWGGLADFDRPAYQDSVLFVSVRIGKRSKIISREETVNALLQMMNKETPFDREKIALMSQEHVGLESCSHALRKALSKEPATFTGFSPLLDFIGRETLLTNTPYMNLNNEINSLYRDIYSAYVRNH